MTFLVHAHTNNHINEFVQQPSHAVGLSGEKGAGKGHAARHIATQLLDSPLDIHPYVLQMDALAQKMGIEEVRSVQDFLKLRVPGTAAIRRVIILENIDQLGHEAQNALLKTLEEPPADTAIFVTFSQRNRILPTIHSRLHMINLLPVTVAQAQDHFKDQHGTDKINKAFYMSSGQAGLLTTLLNETEHPLAIAINEARQLLTASRYQRISSVDSLLKNKELQPSLLLDGMYRLIEAGYKQSVKTKPANQLKPMVARLALVENAINDLNQNVQAKLVLSRLFLEL